MTYILLRWLVVTLSLLLAARAIPGIEVESLYTALLVALILGIVNSVLRPIVILLTLPITLMTLGLFTFIVNALMFWFVASFVEGFEVSGFVPALLGSILVSVVSVLGNRFIAAVRRDDDE